MGSAAGVRRGRSRAPRQASSRDPGYDAFVSYSHAADGQLAPALQAGLQSLGKPWYRRRALRVFRDKTSLSASPELWPSIERALATSRYFVLLASPEAARSPWVDQEVRWWLEHRSHATMLIGLTGGELAWDRAGGAFDPSRSTALPPAALDWPGTEPLWVDLRWAREARHVSLRDPRFRAGVADLAAPVRNLPKDELIGEDIRQHRRALRLARGGVTLLALFLVLSLLATVLAVRNSREATHQRNAAVAQNVISVARQLAATAINLVDTDFQRASLLASQAYKLHPDSQTGAAVFTVANASPQLVGFFEVGASVTSTAGSSDGAVLVAGTAEGKVVRWDRHTGMRTELMQLEHPITHLYMSSDGNKIAASTTKPANVDGLTEWGESAIWDRGMTYNLDHEVLAMSPSGKLTASSENVGDDVDRGAIKVYRGNKAIFSRDLPHAMDLVQMPDERTVVGLDSAYGYFARFDIESGSQDADGLMSFGAWNFGAELEPDGNYFTYTNGDRHFPIWRLRDGSTIEKPYGYASTDNSASADIAFSAGARKMATSMDGRISVSSFARNKAAISTPINLTGAGAANADTLRFLGQRYLVSGSGPRISLWDLKQFSRLGRQWPAHLASGCSACGPGEVVASPNGTQALQFNSTHDEVAWADLRTGDSADVFLEDGALVGLLGVEAVWLNDAQLFTWNNETKIATIRSGRRLLDVDTSWSADVDVSREPGRIDIRLLGSAERPHVIMLDHLGHLVDFDITGQSAESRTLGTLDVAEDSRLGLSRDARLAWSISPADTDPQRPRSRLLAVNTTTNDLVTDQTVEGAFDGAWLNGARAILWGDGRRLTQVDLNDRKAEPSESSIETGDNVFLAPGLPFLVQDISGQVSIVDTNLMSVVGSFRVPSEIREWTSFGFAESSSTLVAANGAADEDTPTAFRMLQIGYSAWIQSACDSAGRDLTLDEWKTLTDLAPPKSLRCTP